MKNFKELDDIFPTPPKVEKNKKFTPLDFYGSVIPYSKKIRFKLGYFSTNAISTLAPGFAQFIFNGGEIELMINHFVTENDYRLLNSSKSEIESKLELIESKYLDDVESLNIVLKSCTNHFFNCLKYLIHHTKQIKIIPVTCGDGGLAHYKEAIFEDIRGNKIYTNGSGNFTQSGILDNGESFIIHRSWRNQDDRDLINYESKNFDSIFNKKATNQFIYLSNTQLNITINNKAEDKNLLALLEDENIIRSQLSKRDSISAKQKIFEEKLINENQNQINKLRGYSPPRFPFPSPRSYQVEALKKWKENEKKGLFAMATGTGKTLTSLNCLLDEYNTLGTYKAIIIVPTVALVNQWQKECAAFNYKNIVCINSRTNWQKDVGFINAKSLFKETSFILITTYASFVKPKFQAFFKNLDKNTLFIADEAHNLGSPQLLNLLPTIHLNKRIGLSATPDRVYDTDSNTGIDDFFNDKSPYVYSFSMKQAIDQGFLCRYMYYPHIVKLDEEEQNAYDAITKSLLPFFNKAEMSGAERADYEMLLLKRKRIIHKARKKLPSFKSILKQEFEKSGNLNYTLVYVPEGVEPNYIEEDDNIENDEEKDLIDEYTRTVSSINRNLFVKQFTSKSKNRAHISQEFRDGKVNVLTSMKCLDEGVDIPQSKMAIFCASTGNPRQFIQRRGRVLRKAAGKNMAIIHDLVVIPFSKSNDSSFREMDRSLVKNELSRVVNFAFLAENKMTTFAVFDDICKEYKLNLYEIHEGINKQKKL